MVYTSFKQFMLSGSELLECKTYGTWIEGGSIFFYIDCDGITYQGCGSYDNVSSYDWVNGEELQFQCNFDNFLLYELCNVSNEICNWCGT